MWEGEGEDKIETPRGSRGPGHANITNVQREAAKSQRDSLRLQRAEDSRFGGVCEGDRPLAWGVEDLEKIHPCCYHSRPGVAPNDLVGLVIHSAIDNGRVDEK